MRTHPILLALMLAALTLAAGCGKKGALYLPDSGKPAHTEQAKP